MTLLAAIGIAAFASGCVVWTWGYRRSTRLTLSNLNAGRRRMWAGAALMLVPAVAAATAFLNAGQEPPPTATDPATVGYVLTAQQVEQLATQLQALRAENEKLRTRVELCNAGNVGT